MKENKEDNCYLQEKYFNKRNKTTIIHAIQQYTLFLNYTN